jgi:hypothetical protein
MLASMLRSHLGILMFSELFRSDISGRVPFGIDGFRKRSRDSELVKLRKTNPVEFLEQEVFCAWPDTINAVGFKLMYTHGRAQPMWWDDPDDEVRWNPGRKVFWNAESNLWGHLYENEEVKVLHLTRRNYLERVLSVVRAKETGEWRVEKGRESKRKSVHVEPKFCEKEFELYDKKIKNEKEKIDNKRKIEIEYEDLISEKEEETMRIQNFLGICEKKLSESTEKQIKRKAPRAIRNYDELSRYFEGTKWEVFFE